MDAKPAIVSTVTAANVLLLGIALAAVSLKEEATLLRFTCGFCAVFLLTGWFPPIAREAVQDWRRYRRGGDE